MKIVYHDEEDNRPLIKMIGVAVIVVIIVIIIIVFFFHRKNQSASVETEQSISTEGLLETEREETEAETETETEGESQEADFDIENRQEFIDPILGSFAGKVNEAVRGFVFQNNISATSAVCLDCAVALDDTSCTEFYLQLNDPAGTLVTARYSPQTTGVTVSNCVYSLEEIKEETWMLDNGPAVRDSTETPTDTSTDTEGVHGVVTQSWPSGNTSSFSGTKQGAVSENLDQPAQNTSSIATGQTSSVSTGQASSFQKAESSAGEAIPGMEEEESEEIIFN